MSMIKVGAKIAPLLAIGLIETAALADDGSATSAPSTSGTSNASSTGSSGNPNKVDRATIRVTNATTSASTTADNVSKTADSLGQAVGKLKNLFSKGSSSDAAAGPAQK